MKSLLTIVNGVVFVFVLTIDNGVVFVFVLTIAKPDLFNKTNVITPVN